MPTATATQVLDIIPGRSPSFDALASKAVRGLNVTFTTKQYRTVTVVVISFERESGTTGPWTSMMLTGFLVSNGRPFKAYYTATCTGTITINPRD